MSPSSPAPLQNVYYERKVGTAKPCYICRRETTTVLATLRADDFVYTCEGHLTDPASPIAPPPSATPSGPSADDIKRVIGEYESRQAKKPAAAKADEADKDKEKDKEKGKGKEGDKAPAAPLTPTSPPAAPTPTHRKFALHRQIFDMRRNEIKRRELGARAKEVGKGMPQVPRGF